MDLLLYKKALKEAKKMIDEHLADLPIATDASPGAVIVGDNLSITQTGVLSVKTSSVPEDNDPRPITSAAVYREIGDINSLLAAI